MFCTGVATEAIYRSGCWLYEIFNHLVGSEAANYSSLAILTTQINPELMLGIVFGIGILNE